MKCLMVVDYRLYLNPDNRWYSAFDYAIEYILKSLPEITEFIIWARLHKVEKAEGKDPIIEALESAVDILEQKLSRGGAMIFQLRRTASDWKRQEGNVEELRYTIKDWKSRAEALS